MKTTFLFIVFFVCIAMGKLNAQMKIDTNSLEDSNEKIDHTNVNLLFQKYGQTIVFNDENRAKMRVLVVKNGGEQKTGLSFRIGYYGYSFVLVPPGLEANLTYETTQHKFELTAMGFSSFYADDYGSLRANYTINYYRKAVFGQRKLNANPFITRRAYNTNYLLLLSKRIKFKMGNYFGVERYIQHEYFAFDESSPKVNIFGTTLHAGFSFSWFSDFRFMAFAENDDFTMQNGNGIFVENDKIYKKSKEHLFYFGYQHSFLDDYTGKANSMVDHGFVIGLLVKNYNKKYSVYSRKVKKNVGWFYGVESGIQAGPKREFTNVSLLALRVGVCL